MEIIDSLLKINGAVIIASCALIVAALSYRISIKAFNESSLLEKERIRTNLLIKMHDASLKLESSMFLANTINPPVKKCNSLFDGQKNEINKLSLEINRQVNLIENFELTYSSASSAKLENISGSCSKVNITVVALVDTITEMSKNCTDCKLNEPCYLIQTNPQSA